jgi:hypothetical protein
VTRAFPTGAGAPPTGPPPAAAGPSAWQRALGAVAWLGLLVGMVVALHRMGSGSLSTPPLLDRAALQRWLDGRDAVTVAFAVVRLVALVLGWYLLVVTTVGLAARATRIPALVRLTDLATVPAVRRALGAVAGVGLSASAATLMAGSLLPDQAPPAGEVSLSEGGVVLQRLPDQGDVVLRRLPDQEGSATMRVEDRPGGSEGSTTPTEWTARPGDHLWHVAEATLAGAWGRAPSDAEVAPYWQQVVEANRGGLADPGNPDLILPGQVLQVPPPPPPPPPAAAG